LTLPAAGSIGGAMISAEAPAAGLQRSTSAALAALCVDVNASGRGRISGRDK
jgi:hypothetical protein